MPHDDTTIAQLQEIAGPLVRAKVRRWIGKAGLRQQDRPDLEQEVWTQLWPRLRAFDCGRGRPHGFLAIVIERILANHVRDRFAAKRNVRRVLSLPQQVSTAQGQVELSPEGSACREVEESGLVLDVADVIARLPAKQQELAEQLQHHSLAEIARQRSLPRSTLQSQVRKLRAIFDRAGLRDYL